MLSGVKSAAADAARKAALFSTGLLCLGVGAGFLTSAAWIVLAQTYDVLTAATVIGCAYSGVGAILIAVVLIRRSQPNAHKVRFEHATDQPKTPDAPPLMQAFLVGLQAGLNSERRTN